MSVMVFLITSLTTVYPTVYSGADQRKHQSSASLAFARGIHRWPVNSPQSSVNPPHTGPVTRKMFPFDDVIMNMEFVLIRTSCWMSNPLGLSCQWFETPWSWCDIVKSHVKRTSIAVISNNLYWHIFVTLSEGIHPKRVTMMPHERHGISNHQHLDCLFISLLRLTTKNVESQHFWPFCERNPVWIILDSKVHVAHLGQTGPRWAPCWPHECCYLGCIPLTNKTESVFMSWHHHEMDTCDHGCMIWFAVKC